MSLYLSYWQSATTTYKDMVKSLSPKGYWACDEASGNLVDATGNGYSGTVTGSPTYAATGPTIRGVVQRAITWGSGKYATVSEGIDDGLTASDGMTISFWMNTTDTGDLYPISKTQSGQKTWEVYGNAGRLQPYLYQDDGATSNAYTAFVGSNNLDDGTWHHAVVWRDGSTGYLYIDVDGGTYTASDTTLTGTWNADSSSQLRIAADGPAALYFPGSLAHVAYWRRMLSSVERTMLYTGG